MLVLLFCALHDLPALLLFTLSSLLTLLFFTTLSPPLPLLALLRLLPHAHFAPSCLTPPPFFTTPCLLTKVRFMLLRLLAFLILKLSSPLSMLGSLVFCRFSSSAPGAGPGCSPSSPAAASAA